ncbi:hypothetical protein QD460_33470, partial [Rhizobium jaguaris]|uniref:hypothetical protein n=1 Tax=Rhizobium jaguaris TaxID=1312183 RepID=UPI0039BF727D
MSKIDRGGEQKSTTDLADTRSEGPFGRVRSQIDEAFPTSRRHPRVNTPHRCVRSSSLQVVGGVAYVVR